MTKKLSKQLCDICDIPFERHIDNCRVVDNEGDLCEQYVEILDFGQPENFVGLLKIANDVLGGVHFATAYTKNKPHIFEEQALIHYLPIAKLNNSFQRAIREAEWVYG